MKFYRKFYRDFYLLLFGILFVAFTNAINPLMPSSVYFNQSIGWVVLLMAIALFFLYKQIRAIDKKDVAEEKEREKKFDDNISTLNKNLTMLSSKLNKLDKLDKLDKIDKLINFLERRGIK